MKTKSLAGFAALALLPMALTGCYRGYEVEVRNLTDQPVMARIATNHPDGAPRYHRTGRAGPGDRTSMFMQAGATQRLILDVDFAGNVGYPATLDLGPGRTIVNVRRRDEGARGGIMLEEIPRP